jgi:tRNA A-37 threonylcarbamoyl transferase component Bud32/tetratricopeptide (TPR) repeat protein
VFDASMHERRRDLPVDEHATDVGQTERDATDEQEGVEALASAGRLGEPSPHDLEHRRIVSLARRRLFGRGEIPQIGRFRVERRIGAGGMGEVYLAHDDELGRKVAIKRVRASLDRPQVQERLRREARALARLSHPNVVQVYEFGLHEGRTFVAMEFVDGRTLGDALREGGQGWREVLALFLAAGRGLAAVHEAGLVHRDFKPDNVLLSRDGRVLVADFGLVMAGEEQRADPKGRPSLYGVDVRTSVTGAILGTIRFMPLEQLLGVGVDSRSDQFSYCVSLYEALWGKPPYSLANTMARIDELERGVPVRPRAREGLRPPLALWRVVRRGLAREPAERWPDMPALLDALEATLRGRRRSLFFGSLGLASTLGVGAVLMTNQTPVDACALVERELHGTWDTARRSELEHALAGLDQAGEVGTRVVAGLDRWASGWVTQREQLCRASEGQSIAPELARLEGGCLTRQRQRVEDLVDLLATADTDAPVLAGALDAVLELPSAAACADELALLGVEPPPSTLEREVEQLRRDLDKSATLRRLGRVSEALTLAETGEQRARALGYRPLLAESLAELAKAEIEGGSLERGMTRMAEAIDESELARHDYLAAELWLELALHSLVDLERDELGAWQLHRAEISNGRIPAGARTHARVAFARGILAELQGDREQAKVHFVAAIDQAQSDPGAEVDAPTYRISLARVVGVHDPDEQDVILRRALADSEHIFGEHHPATALAAYSLALALAQRESSAPELTELLLRATAIWRHGHTRPHRDLANAEYLLALSAVRARDFEEALVHARAAAALQAEVLPADHVDRATTAELLGVLASVRGDHEEAAKQYRIGVDITRSRFGVDDPLVQRGIGNLAATLLALGRMNEAESLLEELLPHVEGEALIQVRLQRSEIALRSGALDLARDELDEIAEVGLEAMAGHQFSFAVLEAVHALRSGRPTDDALARVASTRASTPFTEAQIVGWLDQLGLTKHERSALNFE